MSKFAVGYRTPVMVNGVFHVLHRLPTGDFSRLTLLRERKGNKLVRADVVFWSPPRKAKEECVPYEFGQTTA
jgi:hypothetical protein